MKSIFPDFVDKPMSKMDNYEKILFLDQNIHFQLGIRKRVIIRGKEFKLLPILNWNKNENE